MCAHPFLLALYFGEGVGLLLSEISPPHKLSIPCPLASSRTFPHQWHPLFPVFLISISAIDLIAQGKTKTTGRSQISKDSPDIIASYCPICPSFLPSAKLLGRKVYSMPPTSLPPNFFPPARGPDSPDGFQPILPFPSLPLSFSPSWNFALSSAVLLSPENLHTDNLNFSSQKLMKS